MSNFALTSTLREESKITVDLFNNENGKVISVSKSEAQLKPKKIIRPSMKKRSVVPKSLKLKVILVDSRIEEKGGSGYDGMNWYAAKWLNKKRHTVDFPYPKDTIIINKQLDPYGIAWVIKHEKIEVDLMRKNPKMSYLEAHAKTLIAQGITSEDDLRTEVAEVQKIIKMLAT